MALCWLGDPPIQAVGRSGAAASSAAAKPGPQWRWRGEAQAYIVMGVFPMAFAVWKCHRLMGMLFNGGVRSEQGKLCVLPGRLAECSRGSGSL